MIEIKFKKLHPNARIPQHATLGSACADIYAVEDVRINPGQTVAVRTGLSVEFSDSYEIQIRPRSGLAMKEGISVLNTPGCIDSDFRGEIKVILHNFNLQENFSCDQGCCGTDNSFLVRAGDRIAQMSVAPIIKFKTVEVTELSETERGTGGFGSTGT